MAETKSGVRIVTDTTACIEPEFLQAHGVEKVPQVIQFGEESSFEGVEIAYAEFIRRLRSAQVLPKTAPLRPGSSPKHTGGSAHSARRYVRCRL